MHDDAPVKPSDITPLSIYLNRRSFMLAGAASLLLSAESQAKLTFRSTPSLSNDQPNSLKDITSYNNFYEFGSAKDDPARYANRLVVRPWEITIDGEVEKPRTFSIDSLLRMPLEERIYRLRCVEGWSMVIPWVGVPLSSLLKQVKMTSRARYVAFESAYHPQEMPAEAQGLMPWPYREGLRIDEAMHPLTLLTVGLYGDVLPKQNGAPVRLVVPWKYGFKSAKSIIRIHLNETPPQTSWNLLAPQEYGFYSNVNPAVDHPRWRQNTERRIGEFFRRPTLMFNGYANQVASLYKGMDLRKNF